MIPKYKSEVLISGNFQPHQVRLVHTSNYATRTDDEIEIAGGGEFLQVGRERLSNLKLLDTQLQRVSGIFLDRFGVQVHTRDGSYRSYLGVANQDFAEKFGVGMGVNPLIMDVIPVTSDKKIAEWQSGKDGSHFVEAHEIKLEQTVHRIAVSKFLIPTSEVSFSTIEVLGIGYDINRWAFAMALILNLPLTSHDLKSRETQGDLRLTPFKDYQAQGKTPTEILLAKRAKGELPKRKYLSVGDLFLKYDDLTYVS